MGSQVLKWVMVAAIENSMGMAHGYHVLAMIEKTEKG
jgi:hypothetical protein